ncbi:toprim domain-containing protein [Mycoplasma sp. P36-A1]|uniref:toprim domain-containing protein n=1 Tax=Mycoplasma sp. P36-A1 TaxID=3252900 RepID=UPI003C3024F3
MDNTFRKAYFKSYLIKSGINIKKHFICINSKHKDRNPSMFFYSNSNIVYCFGCRQYYDFISYVMITNKCDYYSALRIIDLFIIYEAKNEVKKVKVVSKKINYDLIQHKKYVLNVEKCKYLKKRGIAFQIAKENNIGYNKISKEILIPTYYPNKSLLIKNTSDNKYYYKKNHLASLTYNLNINANNIIYITEGIFDALSFASLDKNYICLNGLSTINYLEQFIVKISSVHQYELVIALDNDPSGLNATKIIKNICLKHKINFSFINIDPYKDINEIFIKDLQGLVKSIMNSEKALEIIKTSKC